jgi:serralysin
LIATHDSFATAIFATGALTLNNTGTMVGQVIAAGQATITTSGQILGSINLGATADTVRVMGLVDGDIYLGSGANRFVLSGGLVTGRVYGGAGDDIYFIDRSDMQIQDFGGTRDVVYSTVDYHLGFGIDQLYLTGPQGLRGIGNLQGETLVGDVGNDTLYGRGGDDYLAAEDGNNQLYGGAGNDALFMGEGNDRAEGNAGDDTIFGSLGADTIKGGLGVDLLQLNAADLPETGMVVNLATGRAVVDGISTTQISGIENILGSVGDDRLTGDGRNNRIDGSLVRIRFWAVPAQTSSWATPARMC